MELDGPLADGNQGEADGEKEKREELGVAVEVGSEVEMLAAEEDEEEEEEEEEVVLTELRDPWLEGRKVYMATAYCVDMVRNYLGRTTGDPKTVNDATKSIYACVGHLSGVSVWKSRESS